MKIINGFTPRQVGLWVWGCLTVTTLLLYLFLQLPEYPRKALPLVWCFFSWNFYAYAFDRDMWPFTFVELDGKGKGEPGWRSFWFWFSAALYSLLLATVAWYS